MENLLQNISTGYYTLIVFTISFGISYILLPKLILLVQYKNLMDHPDARSSHFDKIPTLGGVAFFVSIVLGIFFIKSYDVSNISTNIIAGLTILFIIGLKDDLMILAPKTKILAQLVAISFILGNTEMSAVNFYGFLGITTMPGGLSIAFGYFIVLSIINAYNLIDGIDGLASMVGIVIFFVFALIFYNLHIYYYSLLAMISIGFLSAFLRYNLSSRNKIFMGDTGSMIVGLLIGTMTLRFLVLEPMQLQAIAIQPSNLLWLTLVILFVPFLDTVRVFILRVWNNKSPFSPDRNHIHHILIDLGLKHFQATMIIAGFNILVVLVFYEINILVETATIVMLFILLTLITVLVLFHLNSNYKARRQKVILRSAVTRMIRPGNESRRKRLVLVLRSFLS